MRNRSAYALTFAVCIFCLNAAGRILGSLFDCTGLYDIAVGLCFVAVFVHFALIADKPFARAAIITMLYFVVYCLLKEMILSPTAFYIAEVPITIVYLWRIVVNIHKWKKIRKTESMT